MNAMAATQEFDRKLRKLKRELDEIRDRTLLPGMLWLSCGGICPESFVDLGEPPMFCPECGKEIKKPKGKTVCKECRFVKWDRLRKGYPYSHPSRCTCADNPRAQNQRNGVTGQWADCGDVNEYGQCEYFAPKPPKPKRGGGVWLAVVCCWTLWLFTTWFCYATGGPRIWPFD